MARVGDCDDLSILYAALLETSGHPGRLPDHPGPHFRGLQSRHGPQDGAGHLRHPDDLLLREDGTTWLPVEITRVRDGFLRAWKEGAQEWRAAGGAGSAEFVPLLAAWQKFPAVDTGRVLQGSTVNPDPTRVFQAYSMALTQFYRNDFEPRIDEVQAALKKDPNDAKLLNRLGVLYARFGMNKEARAQFEQIVKTGKDAFPAVLINLGNLAYLEGNFQDAFDFYFKALEKLPESPVALLGLARAAYELGKNADVKDAYDRLSQAAPEHRPGVRLPGGGGRRHRARRMRRNRRFRNGTTDAKACRPPGGLDSPDPRAFHLLQRGGLPGRSDRRGDEGQRPVPRGGGGDAAEEPAQRQHLGIVARSSSTGISIQTRFRTRRSPSLRMWTGTSDFDPSTRILSITPDYLESATGYTVSVTEAVMGTDGSSLRDPYAWSFTTKPGPGGTIVINSPAAPSAEYTNTVDVTYTINANILTYRLSAVHQRSAWVPCRSGHHRLLYQSRPRRPWICPQVTA